MLHIPWRTGVNMREFAYYGTHPFQYTTTKLQNDQLAALQGLNVKVVRFWASQHDSTLQASVAAVKHALDLILAHGMQAIVCLDDSLTGATLYIPGSDNYHNQAQGHLNANYWTDKAYLSHYIPQVTSIVSACKDHAGVLMWELGNEYLAVLPPPSGSPTTARSTAFYQFAKTASELIKSLAPTHLVSTGLMNSRQISAYDGGDLNAFAQKLYGLNSLDAISVHYYLNDGEESYANIDIAAANALGKPFYLGEFGAKYDSGGRPAYYKQQLDAWKNKGAFLAMPWAFDCSSMDIGVCDGDGCGGRFGDFGDIKTQLASYGVPVDPFRLTTAYQPISTPFTVQPYLASGVIGPHNVHIRKVPTTDNNDPIATLPSGTAIVITGKVSTTGTPADWYQISYQNQAAYLATTLVTLNTPPT